MAVVKAKATDDRTRLPLLELSVRALLTDRHRNLRHSRSHKQRNFSISVLLPHQSLTTTDNFSLATLSTSHLCTSYVIVKCRICSVIRIFAVQELAPEPFIYPNKTEAAARQPTGVRIRFTGHSSYP